MNECIPRHVENAIASKNRQADDKGRENGHFAIPLFVVCLKRDALCAIIVKAVIAFASLPSRKSTVD